MNIVLSLTLRNLKLFYRNKSLVFFSFLSVFIILGLYVLFLAEIQINNIEAEIGMVEGIDALIFAWMLPGVIAVASMTLSLGNMGQLVDDEDNQILLDFLVSPMKRSQLILSYLLSSIVISLVILLVMFGLSIVIVYLKGGALLKLDQILNALVVIILLILSSSLLSLLIASFVKSQNTYGVINTLVGTFIGFVTGAYMPMGIMPIFVQNTFNILPVSMGASLLRQIFLRDIMADVFKGAPAIYVSEYRYFQGIDLKVFDHLLEPTFMIMMLLLSVVVLFVCNLIRFSKLNKRI